MIVSSIGRAQYVYTIKADSIKITGASCDSAELILQNHTQGIQGFLFNTGRGRTIFQRGIIKLNDTTYVIGADTLKAVSPSALQQFYAPPIDTVDNLYELVHYSRYPGVHTIVVSDTIRGGVFNWFPSGLPDSGKAVPATGFGSGCWIRNVENEESANPWWYGMKPSAVGDTTGARANAIALQRCLNYNHHVKIPSGTYYIDSTIWIAQGADLGGSKSMVSGVTGGGTSLITADTVTAIAYALTGDINALTHIHDLSLSNAASGGKTNAGIIISRSFYDIERLSIGGFGGDGLRVTSSFNGTSTVADNGHLELVVSNANGGHGIDVGSSSGVSYATLIQCQATNNAGSGFYLSGNQDVLINCSASNNAEYAFDDEATGDEYINPFVAGGPGDTILFNGFGGIYDVGNYSLSSGVLAGAGLSTWGINIGDRHSGSQQWMAVDPANTKRFNTDSIVNMVSGGEYSPPGTLNIGATVMGTPNNVNQPIMINGVNGTISTWGLQIATAPNTSDPLQGKLWLGNAGGFAAPYIFGYYGMIGLGTNYGTNNYIVERPYTDQNGGEVASLSIAPYFAPGYESKAALRVFDANSNQYSQRRAGLEIWTAEDTAATFNGTYRGYSLQPNARAVEIDADTVNGDMQFTTWGVAYYPPDGVYRPSQSKGGNFNFENHDASTNLYINTFNKSTYAAVLKTGPYPSGSTSDSILVWNQTDSSIRKVAPAQFVGGLGADTVWGNVGSSGSSVSLSLAAANVTVTFSYSSSTAESVSLSTISGSATVNWARSAINGATAVASSTGDGVSLSTTPSVIDAAVYNQSNEQWHLNVMNPATHAVYEVSAMLANNGSNTVLWAHRIF